MPNDMNKDVMESRVRQMLKLGGSRESNGPEIEIEIGESDIDPMEMTLESASEDLLSAVKSDNAKEIANAFRSMFEALMQHHEESESPEYEAKERAMGDKDEEY